MIQLLEGISLILLGLMLLLYRLRNQLVLLIHANYVGIATLTAGCLSLLGLILVIKAIYDVGLFRFLGSWGRWLDPDQDARSPIQALKQTQSQRSRSEPHLSLLAPRVGVILLLITASLGLLITPRPLSGQTAINRGVSPNLSFTRDQPQEFRPKIDPRERSLIDWVRTLDVYPDPFNYVDQPVDVDGFVIHPEDAPAGSFVLARFLISCCAADAYPVGLPVIWAEATELTPDSWQRVIGRMQVQSRPTLSVFNSGSQDGSDPRSVANVELVIQAEQITPIPIPENPYAN